MTSFEERTGEALNAIADSVGPVPDLWARTQRRIVRRRNRRVTSVVVVVGVAVAGAVFAAIVRHPPVRRLNVVGSHESRYPSHAVAVTADHRLVVLDARTGRELRVLATGVDAVDGFPTVAVAPDGNTIFFDRARATGPGECRDGAARVEEIARVPIGGGPVLRVVRGAHPAISPDGKSLAYATRNDDACNGDPNSVVVVAVKDIDKLATRFPGLIGRGFAPADPSAVQVFDVSWASDSRHLAVSMGARDGGYPRILDTQPTINTPLESLPKVPVLDGDGLRVAYLGTTGSLVDTSAQRAPNAVTAIDPLTGRVTRRLFNLPCTSSEGIAPAADLTGTSVLEIAQAPDSTGRCTDALLRWSEGDSTATRIGGATLAIAWAPDPVTLPVATDPERMCSTALGRSHTVLNASATSVQSVRDLTIGPGTRVAPHAFATAQPKDRATWCWTGQPTNYTLFAVGPDGSAIRAEGLSGPTFTSTPAPGPAPIP